MNNFNDELIRLWDVFVGWLPLLLSAIIAFIIGWIISLILESIVKGILYRVGLNRRIDRSRSEGAVHRLTNDPSASIGRFVYWLGMTITILISLSYLKIPVLNEFIQRIYNYVPNLVGSIFILVVALAVSGAISGVIQRWMGDTVTGRVLSAAIPIVILSISGFAILEQLRVAPVIISTTYISIMGGVALAFALAFGLGGKDIASKILDKGYEKGAQSYHEVKKDLAKGGERAKRDAEKVKEAV